MINDYFYFAIFKNGEYAKCETLEDATNVPAKVWIIKAWQHDQHTTNFGNKYKYLKYQVIDEEGKRDSISIGNCTCVDIGEEIRQAGNDCRLTFKVVDRLGEAHPLKYSVYSEKGLDILVKLFEDMEKIDMLGGFESWTLEEDNRQLTEENLKLKKEISELNEEIEKLKIEAEDQKKLFRKKLSEAKRASS